MADSLKKMSTLMTNTRKLMVKIQKTFPVEPLKCFDYVQQMSDNFKSLEKLNSNDENFNVDKVDDEFIESLEKFIKVTGKHRQDESSPYHTVLNKDNIVQLLVDLEKRYDQLSV